MKVVRFLFMLSVLNCLAVAFAAEYVWDGSAGDGKWSSAANWTPDGVPGRDDDVVFAASSGSATVDEGFGGEVMNLTLQEGYSGTITLGRQLIVAKTLKQESGGFACGDHDLHLGPKSRTVNQYLYPAKLELVGGTFTAPSGLLRVYSKDASGSVTIRGCSFNAVYKKRLNYNNYENKKIDTGADGLGRLDGGECGDAGALVHDGDAHQRGARHRRHA